VDTSRVSQGEVVAGIGAVALFIFLFLPWYGVGSTGFGGGGSLSAWEAFSFIDVLLFLVAAVVVGLVLARAAGATPELPQPPAVIILCAGGIAVVLILFRLLVAPDLDAGFLDPEVDLEREIGVFLGLISAAGIAYGGWRAMNDAVTVSPQPGPPSSTPPWER
jgi:hypothetical protein